MIYYYSTERQKKQAKIFSANTGDKRLKNNKKLEKQGVQRYTVIIGGSVLLKIEESLR